MEIEWTEAALADMAALDKGIALRVKQSIERFAETGAANVKRLQGICPSSALFPITISKPPTITSSNSSPWSF